jgi:hypothetical protein
MPHAEILHYLNERMGGGAAELIAQCLIRTYALKAAQNSWRSAAAKQDYQ